MKITIDTKEDSHAEIQKVIKMLSSLMGEQVMTNSPEIAEKSSDAFSNMFSEPENKEDTEDKDEDTEDKEDTDIPQIMEY